MVSFDSSFLIILFNPLAPPAYDRDHKPVPKCRERIEHLVQRLSNEKTVIVIPTPALAELLVRAGKAGPSYLKELTKSSRFKISEFDTRAAIDTAALVRKVKDDSTMDLETAAKIKFDFQIVCISKAEKVKAIFSEDNGLAAKAHRIGIPTFRVCDLELPPEPEETAHVPQERLGLETTTSEEESSAEEVEEPESVAEASQVRGGDSGHSESESASKAAATQKPPEKAKPAQEGGLSESGS